MIHNCSTLFSYYFFQFSVTADKLFIYYIILDDKNLSLRFIIIATYVHKVTYCRIINIFRKMGSQSLHVHLSPNVFTTARIVSFGVDLHIFLFLYSLLQESKGLNNNVPETIASNDGVTSK